MSDNTEQTEEVFTHWKAKFSDPYMGPQVIPSNLKSIFLTIDRMDFGKKKGSDGKDVEGMIIYFREKDSWIKPLWCGRYQCGIITEAMRPLLKADAIYDRKWIGITVQLSVFTETWFGSTDDYLRIHKVVKVEKPVLSPDMENWAAAVEAVFNGTWSLEDVTSKRKMTPEHIIQLQTDVELKRQPIEEKKEDA